MDKYKPGTIWSDDDDDGTYLIMILEQVEPHLFEVAYIDDRHYMTKLTWHITKDFRMTPVDQEVWSLAIMKGNYSV